MKWIGVFVLITLVLISAPVSAVTYDQLARYPDQYQHKEITMVGEVIEAQYSDDQVLIRINTKKTSYGYMGDDMYIGLELDPSMGRILEDDIIEVTGGYSGLFSYTTVLGATRTIPSMWGTSYRILS